MARESQLAPWQPGTRAWRNIPKPWTSPEFEHELQQQMAEMVVSHRPEHKISGELHKGTNYGKPYLLNGKSTVHARCTISALSASDIDDVIVDRAVRDAVRAKLAEIGGNPKAFEKPENLPHLLAANGRAIPIRRVRIRQTKDPKIVATGSRERFVDSAGIHHAALFVVRDAARKETWISEVIQTTDVYDRAPRRDKRPGRPRNPVYGAAVSRVSKEYPEAEFLFSLMKDDTVEMDFQGERAIFRVKKFYANGQIWFTAANNAQDDAEQKKQKTTWSKYPNTLRPLNPRKVVVDLLGKVHPAND
jgi:hypothetical protein